MRKSSLKSIMEIMSSVYVIMVYRGDEEKEAVEPPLQTKTSVGGKISEIIFWQEIETNSFSNLEVG